MTWCEETYYEHKTKRGVGRPVKSPFLSPQIEEEFVRRGDAMLRMYYRPQATADIEANDQSKASNRLDFDFGHEHKMSKTQFWSIIYLFYLNSRQIGKNMQGFIYAIQSNFGTEVVSDRTSLVKCVKMLEFNGADSIRSDEEYDDKIVMKYRNRYKFVKSLWMKIATIIEKH